MTLEAVKRMIERGWITKEFAIAKGWATEEDLK